MADAKLIFENKPNESLQVGDLILYTSVSNGFNDGKEDLVNLGIVKNFNQVVDDSDTNYGKWEVNVNKNSNVALPTTTDYILFAKDSRANMSGVKGYYAEVEMINNKTTNIELFSVNTEVSQSSK